MPQRSPKASKQSFGRAEGMHAVFEAMCRTWMEQVKEDYGLSFISVDHPIVEWMVRHIAWLHERFSVGRDGRTPFERHQLRVYSGQVVKFVETVIWRQPGPIRYKLDSHWGYGVWLGRDHLSDSHIFGSRHGWFLVRCSRRLPEGSRGDKNLLLGLKGAPSQQRVMGMDQSLQKTLTYRPSRPPLPELWSGKASTELDVGEQAAAEVPEERKRGTLPPLAEENETDLQQEEGVPSSQQHGTAVDMETERGLLEPEPPSQDEQRKQDRSVELQPEPPGKKPRGRPPTRELPDPGSSSYTPGCQGALVSLTTTANFAD